MRKIAGATVLWLALASLFVPAVRWRVQAMTLKTTGQAPEWPWKDVLIGMVPGSYRGELLADKLVGDTRFVRRRAGDACPVLWNGPLGLFWAQMNDHSYISWHSRRQAKFEGISPLIPRVRPGDTVLEIGGWVGCFARQAARDGAGLVIAMEPEPTNLECFRRNLRAELAAGQVELIEKAAWSESGAKVRFGVPEIDPEGNTDLSLESFMPMEDGPIEVETITIDDVVEQRGLQRVDLIQMDIEGSERFALRGARKTLQRFAPDLILCLHHLPDDHEVLTALVREINPTYTLRDNGKHGFFVGGRPVSVAAVLSE